MWVAWNLVYTTHSFSPKIWSKNGARIIHRNTILIRLKRVYAFGMNNGEKGIWNT